MRHAMLATTVALAMSAVPAFAQSAAQTPPARAQSPASTQSSDKAASKTGDQHFIHEAAIGGMAEVELGKLATQKASSEQVKQFGQRMVDDHGKANDELKTIAQNKSVTIPSDLDAQHKALRDRLSKLSGDAFDRAYMQEMLKDHRKDVNEFRTESKTGKDADVKAWAAQTLPTLEDHLKMAQDANRAVGTSGTKSKTTKTGK